MTNHDGSSSLMTLGYLDFPPKLGPRIPPFEFVGPSFGYAFINPPYLPARSGQSRSSWHIMAPGYKLPCPWSPYSSWPAGSVGTKRLLLFQAVGGLLRTGLQLTFVPDFWTLLLSRKEHGEGPWRIFRACKRVTRAKIKNQRKTPLELRHLTVSHSFNPLAPGLFEVVSRTPIMQTAQGRGRILADFVLSLRTWHDPKHGGRT